MKCKKQLQDLLSSNGKTLTASRFPLERDIIQDLWKTLSSKTLLSVVSDESQLKRVFQFIDLYQLKLN